MLRESLMDRARDLAERGRYTVAPNPLVGAVVVRDGEVVGEGWHVRAGHSHAEVAALEDAGSDADGATLFVSLEPCNHHGRTPPCTEAVIEAGIERVVIGHLDPDPRMQGRSSEVLRDAGIEVEVLGDAGIERQNEQFFWRMRSGQPFVHLKLAATLDGRIAAAGGDSKWVTGEEARSRAHHLRAEAGAVLVGATTALADDPTLTARELSDEPPRITRVVLDPSLKLAPESRLIETAQDAPVVIFASEDSLDGRQRRLEERGAEVVGTPESADGMDLRFVLDEIGRREVRGLLVEGGGITASRFLREGLVNKMTVFYAPKVVGSEGVPMVGPLNLSRMEDARRFSVGNVEVVGGDVAVTLYPLYPSSTGWEEHVYRTG